MIRKSNRKTFRSKAILFLILAVIVVLASAGCGGQKEKAKRTGETKSTEGTEESTATGTAINTTSSAVQQEAEPANQQPPVEETTVAVTEPSISPAVLLQNKLNELLQNSVSTEPFLNSEGTEVYDFPDSAHGIINAVLVDLNQDGQDEILAVACEGNGDIILKKYFVAGGGIQEAVLGKIFTVEYCSQSGMLLFYNQALGSYCIAINDIMVGAYTGATGFTATLYSIQNDEIVQQRCWEWESGMELWSEDGYSASESTADTIQNEMISLGWPYMENYYLSFRNDQTASNVIQLMGTDVEIPNADDPPAMSTRYLHFLGREEMPSQYF